MNQRSLAALGMTDVKILLVEDDKQTSDYIAKGLREHGHVVDQADNGRDGLYLATGEKYDVMVVDRMLPSMDGLSLVKAARTSNVRTPVLFLTTMGGIDDHVAGFDAGEVVTRTMLLEKVWDFHFDPKTNIVETHISRLRSKIDKGFGRPLLHTVRGAGYVIRAPE